MKKALNNLYKKGADFLLNIGKNSRLVIIFHGDSDGFASAAILAWSLGKIEAISTVYFVPVDTNKPEITVEHIRLARKYKADYILICDIAILPPKICGRLSKLAPTMVIDHHETEFPEEHERFIYINPRKSIKTGKDNECIPPASYIAYNICSRITDVAVVSWIAGLGVAGDWAVDCCLDLFEEIEKVYPSLLKGAGRITQESVMETPLGSLLDYLDAARKYRDNSGAGLVIESLIRYVDMPLMLLSQEETEIRELAQMEKATELEVERLMAQHRTKADFYPEAKLIHYHIDTRFDLKSEIANRLKKLYPDWIILITQPEGENISFSLRRATLDIDLPEFLSNVLSEFKDARGGGHPDSCGGEIDEKSYNHFIKKLLTELKSD